MSLSPPNNFLHLLTTSQEWIPRHQSSLSGVTPVLASSSISHLLAMIPSPSENVRCEILLEVSTGVTPLSDD